MYYNEALSDSDRLEMLNSIGIESMEEIYSLIPEIARMRELNLDEPHNELQAQKKLNSLAKMNKTDYLSFIGSGARKRFVPPVIADVLSRFEFLSCYTPYQAEISQGTLRLMYEFQSAMCSLTNQDVSNASVYDGASAAAEAILMASRLTKKKKVFVKDDIQENYLEVIKTYLWAGGIELVLGSDCLDTDLCAKLYQTPNRFGEFVPMPNKNDKELIISCVDLFSLALVEPPKADITVGDIQQFGIGLNFGGAYAGVITCKDAYKRQLPGRIVGKTLDKEGKTAYCLTLQAREQHIRRAGATSNICSNQALVAASANMYLRKLGKSGFIELAQKSYDNAHALAQKLTELGFEIENKDFFDEFTLNVGSSDSFLAFMKEKGILAGLKIDEHRILVSLSELNDELEQEEYIKAAKNLSMVKIAL